MKLATLGMLLLLLLGAAGLGALPYLRKIKLDREKARMAEIRIPIVEAAAEDEVEQAEKRDESTFDQRLDIRRIRVVPETAVQLEAAFRQRKSDDCEDLKAGEPIHLNRFVGHLTPRDHYREPGSLLPSTRKEVLTIGLSILPSDHKMLPLLSRSAILDFLKNHYVTIQARIQRDPSSHQWLLHYRPVAAIGRINGVPLTQDWVEAVASTVRDIRGLGILENSDKTVGSQTAVMIFRSAWLDESGASAGVRHELLIVHAVPEGSTNVHRNSSESLENALELHVFTTSDLRETWHHFRSESRTFPKRESDCDLEAMVRFDDFTSDGLQPKSSVTRKLTTRAWRRYRSSDLNRYLEQSKIDGGWSRNLDQVLNAMIDGKVRSTIESF